MRSAEESADVTERKRYICQDILWLILNQISII